MAKLQTVISNTYFIYSHCFVIPFYTGFLFFFVSFLLQTNENEKNPTAMKIIFLQMKILFYFYPLYKFTRFSVVDCFEMTDEANAFKLFV